MRQRYVVVGLQVDDPEVSTLLDVGARAGLDVRAAAIVPPSHDRAEHVPGAPPASSRPVLEWHRIGGPQRVGGWLGGAKQAARRIVGGGRELAAALESDPWLEEQLVPAPSATAPGSSSHSAGSPAGHSAATCLVALDDEAGRALTRWCTRRSSQVPLLTWPQAAERLAQDAAASSPEVVPAGTPTQPLAAPAAPSPGAMHRVVVAAPGRATPRRELIDALDGLRSRTRTLDPGAAVPADTDILVLDGLGPVVGQLDSLPGVVRVVHVARPEDPSSPWRHLASRHRLLTGHASGPPPGASELADLVLGADAARLVRLTRAREDDAALLLVSDRLEAGPVTDPVLLREMAYVTRVTGALTLELRVLHATAGLSDVPVAALQRVLARVEDRLRETDPAWLPALPDTPVVPARGRVLHLLKTTLPQRQAGYTVRGHHSLRALVEAGADVVALAVPELLTDGPDETSADAPKGTVPQEVLRDGVRYLVPGAVAAAPGTAYLEAAARAVLDVVRAERPAVLHVHSGHRGYDLGVVGAAVAEATGLPWVYEVRGLFESTWTRDQARAERGETFERRMAREADLAARADATVTLAETMRADLVARGVPQERVHVVPNAVDPEQLRPQDRDPALERRYESAGRFVFGYVSNLDHAREQVEDLVRAAVLLQSRGRPTLCLVVGTGSREKELRSLAERLGAGSCVAFTGRVPHEEVSAYYALLDVLVVPRGDERAARLVTPLKPFEAMAMGVPVVVSSQPALLEVVGDAERGWSYPPGDAVALADLLERLADAPQERAAVAARARDWVIRERTWAGNAIRYLDIYDHLTGSAGQAAPR